MCSPLASGDLPPVVANPEASFDPVRDAVLDLRERVEDLCNKELGKITKQGQIYRSDALSWLTTVSSFLISSSSVFPANDTTLFTLKDCKFLTSVSSVKLRQS